MNLTKVVTFRVDERVKKDAKTYKVKVPKVCRDALTKEIDVKKRQKKECAK